MDDLIMEYDLCDYSVIDASTGVQQLSLKSAETKMVELALSQSPLSSPGVGDSPISDTESPDSFAVISHSNSLNSEYILSCRKQQNSNIQNLRNIEIFAQPQSTQRPCYASDFSDKPPRYIRGVRKELNGKTYKHPAVRIPDTYFNSNRIFYIRVTLTTVELEDGRRYIHPNSLEIVNRGSRSEVLSYSKGILYRITGNDVDSNEIMIFDNLVAIKCKQRQLEDYGDLISFQTGKRCPNTAAKTPKQMIADYQLQKSQLAFSVFERVGQGQWQHIETIFSDVMQEEKEGQNMRTISAKSVFYDKFRSTNKTSDVNQWEFVQGTGENGWGTGQKQYYTVNVDKNARCENGRVIIEARKENYKGCEYTSARLRSKQSFRYGRFEIRAKLPSIKGTWSSFVLRPAVHTYGHAMWPDNGEINLMSHLGRDPTTIRSSVYTKSNNPLQNNTPSNTAEVLDAKTHFKTYTLIWSPDEIEMFVRLNDGDKDDRRILIWEKLDRDWQFWPFDQEFHLEIFLAVGGDDAGNEIDDHQFPERLEIEYVRFKPMGEGEE
ncbi:unnamed protein product [Adineta ricciae]|uniref:GH16 domain-containing protein n=2 Tax=Adineta ricciae TaxID=249248 RepID=A0A815VRC2_ADIRI|nr:unnamed protein product [Adineta ricciae]